MLEYKLAFEFPLGLSSADREDYQEMGEQGFELYKQFCGSCHGITHKGKKSIPNFTDEQLENYNLRWQMNEGSTHQELQDLSDNQLSNILIFLQYRKRY